VSRSPAGAAVRAVSTSSWRLSDHFVTLQLPAERRFRCDGAGEEWCDCLMGTCPPACLSRRLADGFVASYASRPPPFGFNGLGEFVYATRYARVDPGTGAAERWHETVERVVNGTVNLQKRWALQRGLPWDDGDSDVQTFARGLYDRIWTMRMLPPGRGLWAMGSPLTEERGLYAALNNCGFVTTADVSADGNAAAAPFAFLMDAAMLGVGVGFDTRGAGRVIIQGATGDSGGGVRPRITIADSREGWVDSVTALISAHVHGTPRPVFDYSAIRPRGSPIRGFGGTSSGSGVLERLHTDIDGVLAGLAGRPLSVTGIVDVMNLIGRCVVSGDVRQTAEIAFGDPDSEEYVDLKNYDRNPHRAAYGWTSNNSVFARLGQRYDAIAERVVKNGEPGFAWLDNMRKYGRMGDPPDWRDARAAGGNPCLEQTLEGYELCCLVETFPDNHDTAADFETTLALATQYAKTVTLGHTQWAATNAIIARNRRIGVSMSGLAQFVARRGACVCVRKMGGRGRGCFVCGNTVRVAVRRLGRAAGVVRARVQRGTCHGSHRIRIPGHPHLHQDDLCKAIWHRVPARGW